MDKEGGSTREEVDKLISKLVETELWRVPPCPIGAFEEIFEYIGDRLQKWKEETRNLTKPFLKVVFLMISKSVLVSISNWSVPVSEFTHKTQIVEEIANNSEDLKIKRAAFEVLGKITFRRHAISNSCCLK